MRRISGPGPEGRDWARPAERHEGLDEGEDEGGEAEDGVGVGHHEGQTVGPAASVEDDEDDPGDGSGPDEEHEASVPEEPLLLPTTLPVSPGLLVADWSTSMSRTVPSNCFASSLML